MANNPYAATPTPTIIMHPAIAEDLLPLLDHRPSLLPVGAVRLEVSSLVPPEKPTGNIICSDGQVIPRKGFRWQLDRFTTVEESDLPWLLGLGIVKEEMVSVYYEINEFIRDNIFKSMGIPARLLTGDDSHSFSASRALRIETLYDTTP